MAAPRSDPQAVVAGHICLDLIPQIDTAPSPGQAVVRPGGLTQVGPALTSTGGAVSNTGLALHRLGVPTRLAGKVGDDLFGGEVLKILRREDPQLAEGMAVVPGETTSYSVVVSAPGVDRAFLHCPGANDRFTSADVNLGALGDARLLHFGYPPIMAKLYADGGEDLARLFESAKARGMTTSLDTCAIDPASPAARVDWPAFLRRVLPHVDVFLPSADELLFMLHESHRRADDLSAGDLRGLATTLLEMGCAVSGLKLGEQGIYVQTTPDAARLARAGRGIDLIDPKLWLDKNLHADCFDVNVVNANGAGDCTIAGFLAALLRGDPFDAAVIAAAAVGASVCESADANTVPHWSAIERRIARGWRRKARKAC